jgi:hypothetical protein
MGDQPIERPLPILDNSNRYPALEWDSSPRSQCLSERRQVMPWTARLVRPVSCNIHCHYTVSSVHYLSTAICKHLSRMLYDSCQLLTLLTLSDMISCNEIVNFLKTCLLLSYVCCVLFRVCVLISTRC